MKREQKPTKDKKGKIATKLGLGAGGAALLGLAFGSSAQAQERRINAQPLRLNTSTITSHATVRPPAPATMEDIDRSFQLTMNAREVEVWKAANVQAAFAFLSKLPLSERVEFVSNPQEYMNSHNYGELFGFQADASRYDEVGALVKAVRTDIMKALIDLKPQRYALLGITFSNPYSG